MGMVVLLLAFVSVSAATLGLKWLNHGHQVREGTKVPPELAGVVDAERLRRIAEYTRDRSLFAMLSELLRDVGLGVFLFGGLLGSYDGFLTSLALSPLVHGVVFFVGLTLAGALLSIPFSLYSSFSIEARHGFNRMSPRLFWSDWIKSTTLSAVFVALLSGGALFLVGRAPEHWWLYVWVLFVLVSVLVTFLAPYLIEPLFFRMKPLHVPGLEDEVRALAERAGVQVSRVLEVDASRRSSHSNAYFTGFGPVKRVVLFDTLLSHMSHGEILAILAHELGHWRKHHLLFRTLRSFAVALGALYLASRLAPAAGLPLLIGLADASFPARLFILGVIASLLTFPLTPLGSFWSRRHEWQADAYATELQRRPEDLASALSKLASENLSNLHPHPLYAAFYASHPPIPERIRRLRASAAAALGSG